MYDQELALEQVQQFFRWILNRQHAPPPPLMPLAPVCRLIKYQIKVILQLWDGRF